jgi:uncharacterized membrane protein YeiH
MRDLLMGQIPRVLHADVYATAALAGSAIVVAGRAAGLPVRVVAVAGALVCFGVRVAAFTWNWQLPRAI